MNFVQDVHCIFAQAASLLKCRALLAPFRALFADTVSSLSSNCLILSQKRAKHVYLLARVQRAYFTLKNKNGPSPSHSQEMKKNCADAVSSDILCPVTCSPFPSVAMPLCSCSDGPCHNCEPTRESQTQGESPRRSQSTLADEDRIAGDGLEKTTCSNMFWGRRSCSREHQCNEEINA